MRRRGALGVGIALFCCFPRPGAAALFDHSAYDSVLHHYVDSEGLVDYRSIRLNSLTTLESYFELIADADMAGWPYAERLAFWINAYNARVIYEVAQKPHLKKISEDFNLFNRPFKVAGRRLTLNDIKHRILRGTVNPDTKQGPIPGVSFGQVDPRIHFALVCGTVSGPKLRNTAYAAESLEADLLTSAAAFANSYEYVGVIDGRLQLSSLFKWYARDFDRVGGVPAYLSSLITPSRGGEADAVRKLLKTGYKKALFTYDWTVNEQGFKMSPGPGNSPDSNEIPPDAFSTSNPSLGDAPSANPELMK